MLQGLQLTYRLTATRKKKQSEQSPWDQRALALREVLCSTSLPTALHLSTFVWKYTLLLMNVMMIAYAVEVVLLSWGILASRLQRLV